MSYYIYKDILNKFGDRVIITNETAASLYNLGDHHLDEYIDLYARESDKTIEKELIEEFKNCDVNWIFEINYIPDDVFNNIETLSINVNDELGYNLQIAIPPIFMIGITHKFINGGVRLEDSSYFRILYEYWYNIDDKKPFWFTVATKLNQIIKKYFKNDISSVDLIIKSWGYLL